MEYRLILEELEEWAKSGIDFYKKGELCSMGESVHGEAMCREFIQKIEELKKKHGL